MTVLCQAGTSRPKPGVNEVIIFGSSQLGSLLNNKGGLWATLAVGALGVLTYEATALCSTDPPAQPTMTAADYKALLALGPPNEFATALAKLKDLVTIAVWYDLCECTAIQTPPPPTGLLNPPSGVTSPDYNLTPCPQPRIRVNMKAGRITFSDSTNFTQQAFPNLEYTTSVAGDADHPSQEIGRIPPTWTSMDSFTQLVSGSTDTTHAYAIALSQYGENKSPLLTQVIGSCTTTEPYRREPQNGTLTLSPSARYLALNSNAASPGTTDGQVEFTLTVHCVGSAITQPGCCQDPVAISLLNGLVQELQLVRNDVRLLQRYGLPFAYTAGTQHVGLVGTGAAALQRSVGLQIAVTARPPGNQVMLGQPPYIFDLGWVSVLTPDGLLDEIRLTRDTTTWMSKLIPSSTRIGWGLRDGVMVTITELRAEA